MLNKYLWKKGRRKEGRDGRRGGGEEVGREGERKEKVFFQEVAKVSLLAPVIS